MRTRPNRYILPFDHHRHADRTDTGRTGHPGDRLVRRLRRQGLAHRRPVHRHPRDREEAVQTVNGVRCLGVVVADDGVLWVDTATGRPVRMESTPGAKDPGVLNFAEYGTAAEPTLPPRDEVIDVARLRG
jgi:hypothetical protein